MGAVRRVGAVEGVGAVGAVGAVVFWVVDGWRVEGIEAVELVVGWMDWSIRTGGGWVGGVGAYCNVGLKSIRSQILEKFKREVWENQTLPN